MANTQPKKRGCRRKFLALGLIALVLLAIFIALRAVGQAPIVIRNIQQELTPHGEVTILNSDGSQVGQWNIALPASVTLEAHPSGAILRANGEGFRFSAGQVACITQNILPAELNSRAEQRGSLFCFGVEDAGQ